MSGTFFLTRRPDSAKLHRMGRALRAAQGGVVYHVLNRANARLTLFAKPADYEAFELVLAAALRRYQMRLLAYCVMPNHWHLVVWPRQDGDLSRFTGWLTLTHTQRWHAHRHTWVQRVNAAQTAAELEAVRRCVQRGQPYGTESWVAKMVRRLGLEGTIRPRGRPRKPIKGS